MSNATKHTTIGDQYIAGHNGDRIFARGEMHEYSNGVWGPMSNPMSDFWNLVKASQLRATASSVKSIMQYVTSMLYKEDDVLDKRFDLLNLGNGVLNLNTKRLKQHKRDYLFTSQLGFEYDNKATCDHWLKFIHDVLIMPDLEPDQTLIDFVQEAFGYSLTARVEHEISFWLIGIGANGKSTLLSVLEALAGSAALQMNLGLLGRDQYQLADIGGKRVVICSEAPQTTVADAILKAMVSGDPMRVRAIRGNPFTVTPQAKIWWAMNNPPIINDSSEGFWRKLRVIPFNRTFNTAARDKKLKGKLLQELPGIFNWALEGLRRLDHVGDFTECDQIEELTDLYRKESDIAGECLDEISAQSSSGFELSSKLVAECNRWCKDNGYRQRKANWWGRAYRRLGLKPGKDSGDRRGWNGLTLLSTKTVQDILDGI